METQNLRQRVRDEDETLATADSGGATTTTANRTTPDRVISREKRNEMAKRGLRTLGVAVAIPSFITLMNIYYFGTNDTYKMGHRPNWVPPIWALHIACLGSAFLMGLSGWIVWAEGGFHRVPRALPIFLGQFGLSLIWDPLVFRLGANWAGLIVALGVLGALFQCHKMFRQVSQIAGDLVLPCLGWAGLLAFVNLKLMLV